MYGHYYDGPGMGAGWIWGLFMMLFWAAVIALAIWAVIRFTRTGGPLDPGRRHVPPPMAPPHHMSAREILDRRYATGEIDAPTYEEMRSRLEGPAPAEPPSENP